MFDELVLAGGDLTAAKKLVENELILPEGKVCSTYRIKVHALSHTGIDPDKIHPSFLKVKRADPVEVAAQKRQVEVRKAVVEAHLDEVASIDIENILSSLGIRKKPETMDEVLSVAQQIGLGLHMAAGAIAYDRLQKYAKDPEEASLPLSRDQRRTDSGRDDELCFWVSTGHFDSGRSGHRRANWFPSHRAWLRFQAQKRTGVAPLFASATLSTSRGFAAHFLFYQIPRC